MSAVPKVSGICVGVVVASCVNVKTPFSFSPPFFFSPFFSFPSPLFHFFGIKQWRPHVGAWSLFDEVCFYRASPCSHNTQNPVARGNLRVSKKLRVGHGSDTINDWVLP